jgi:hypothetical protein
MRSPGGFGPTSPDQRNRVVVSRAPGCPSRIVPCTLSILTLSSSRPLTFPCCRLLGFSSSRIFAFSNSRPRRSVAWSFCREVLSHFHSSRRFVAVFSHTLRRPLALAHIETATVRILRIPHNSENLMRPSNSENPTSPSSDSENPTESTARPYENLFRQLWESHTPLRQREFYAPLRESLPTVRN